MPGPVWILGAGLARASVAEFVGEYESWIKQPDGLVELFKRNVAIAPGGIPMGFEIVSSHYGGLSHSWVCNDFPKTLGTPLNVHGLVESYADVERTLAAVEADPGKEEGIWRAWLVTRYV